MTREERYALELQSIRQRTWGAIPVRNDDSLERMIKEILDAEFGASSKHTEQSVAGNAE